MNNLTFSSPDLSSFCQLNNLGLTATGQHLCAERAAIECRFTKAPEPCPKCGTLGVSRGTLHLAIGTKLDMPHRKLNAYFKATRDLPLSCRASKKALP